MTTKEKLLGDKGTLYQPYWKKLGNTDTYCIVSFMSTAGIQMYLTQLSSISKGGIMCYFLWR